MSSSSALRGVLRGVTDVLGNVLSPPTCAACDAPIPPRVLFCAACASTVSHAARREDVLVPYVYGAAVAIAVKRFKYGGRSDLAVRLGRALGVFVLDRLRVSTRRVDVVVAVPLHPRKRAARGFEQGELLAREVASLLEVPRLPGGLQRTRETSAQAGLARAERRTNVHGAFACACPPNVRGSRVLLVDDVVTTGCTLRAASSALELGGAASVTTAAFALADPADDDDRR